MSGLKISAHLQSNYEDYYEEGDSEWRWLGALDKADNIQALCKDLTINSVIEIGAGEESVLKRLSELDFAREFYALEISPTGVETIKSKNIPLLKECSLFDGYNIPYENKKFDLAVLSHVVEHVEYPRKLLYEAQRIARYVFVEVPLEDTVRLPRDFLFDKVGHINFYSPKTFRRLIQTLLKISRQTVLEETKPILRQESKNNVFRRKIAMKTSRFLRRAANFIENGRNK